MKCELFAIRKALALRIQRSTEKRLLSVRRNLKAMKALNSFVLCAYSCGCIFGFVRCYRQVQEYELSEFIGTWGWVDRSLRDGNHDFGD